MSLYDLTATITERPQLDLYGGEVNVALSDRSKPPFSRLLEEACKFADKTDASIFESEALKAIVQ